MGNGKLTTQDYAYLRGTYGVPVIVGMRVTALGRAATVLPQGDLAHYLRVRFDDDSQIAYLHPTWQIDYSGVPS